MEKTARQYRVYYILVIIVTAIGSACWLASTTFYSDDYCYMRAVPDIDEGGFWECEGEMITEWQQVPRSMVNHYKYVNGRIPNLLMAPLQFVSRGVSMVVCGLLMGVLLWVMMVAGRRCRDRLSYRWMVLSVVLMWTALPWYDYYQSLAYQLNYVPVSIMSLWLIARARHLERPHGRAILAAVMAVGFFTPWFHEGFGGPLLAALFAMWLMSRGLLRRRLFMLMCAVFAGYVISVVGGTLLRLDARMSEANEAPYLITRYLSQLWPFALGLVLSVCVVARARAGRRRRVLMFCLAPLLLASLIGFAQGVVLGTLSRSIWPSMLYGAIAALLAVSEIVRLSRPRTWATVVAYASIIVYVVWLGGIVKWQRHSADEQRRVVEALTRLKPGEPLCADISIDSIPFWTMKIPGNLEFLDLFFLKTLFGHHRAAKSMIGWSEFAGVPLEEWTRMPGRNNFRGRWPWLVDTDVDSYEATTDFMDAQFGPDCRVILGEPLPAMTPIDRLYMAVRRLAGMQTDTVTARTYYNVFMTDHGKAARVQVETLPRWAAHRRVIAIDTVGAR